MVDRMVFDRSVEQILGMGALLLLGIGCIVVLWPFLSALIWAAVLCFSTWPIYTRLERHLGGRRTPAALLMTLLVAAVVVAPFAILVATLADSVATVAKAVNSLLEQGPPAPPSWVAKIPLIGERLAHYWQGMAYNGPAFLIELTKLIRPATDIAVASGAVLGVGLLELALSVSSLSSFIGTADRWQRMCVVVPSGLVAIVHGICSQLWAQPSPGWFTV